MTKAFDASSPCTAAVIGLGLIGGSFAGALRRARPLWQVVGHDTDGSAARRAEERGLIHASLSRDAALAAADVVVLATPVGAILQLLAELPSLVNGAAVIVDVGSTKRQIVHAMSLLPNRFAGVGGHPMTGALTAGASEPSPALFSGRPFVVTPSPRTTAQTLAWFRTLLTEFGALVVEMDASAHDDAVALVSHLPHLLAMPLLEIYAQADATTRQLVAGGFQTRVQGADAQVDMWHDILRTNRGAVGTAIEKYRGALGHLHAVLENGTDAELRTLLERAAATASETAQRKL